VFEPDDPGSADAGLRGDLSDGERRRFGHVADQAAVAVVNARLFGEERALRHRLEEAHRARRRTTRALRASEERFHAAIEAMPDPFAINSAIRDETGRIVDFTIDYVNEATTAFNGMSAERQTGGRLLKLFPEVRDGGLFDAFVRVVETGEPFARDSVVYEDPNAADGPIRSVLDIRAVKFGDGYIVSSRDFTARARAEDALRDAMAERTRLVSAIEQAPALVMLTDREHRVHYVNAAFETITGYSRAQVLGLDARGLGAGSDDVPAYREATEALSSGGTWSGVLTGRRMDGSPVEEEAVISSMIDDRGDVTGYVTVARDVTRERALEAQLLQAQKMEAVGQLAGGIAHDFNNLLTAIRGYGELLGQGLSEGDPRRADLDEILRGADRAAELTRQLVAFSRRQILLPSVLDVAVIVEGIVPMLRRLLGEHIALVTHGQPDQGRVMADASQLDQVIVNLAVNARDAMPDGGTLTIETANVELDAAYAAAHADATPGPHVLLSASDTGVGMDPETRAHAFEPFFTTKQPGKGTGMGLATVYGIVKQSGGTIDLCSEPGLGTTFRIYLPRIEQEATVVAEAVTVRSATSGSETILLVEDNAAVRAFARRVLGAQGYTVLEAASGTEALSLAASQNGSLDLLVTDVVMPGMQGHQLAGQLRADRPDLRVLYVSGFTEKSVISRGILGQEVVFLPKPFTAEALGHAVRDAIDEPRGAERLGSRA
jgi:PAS domain S-box-containing protein